MVPPTTTCCAGCNRPGLHVDMRQCPRCYIGSQRTICSSCKMCAACDVVSPFKRRRPDDRSPAWTSTLDASWGQVDRFFLEGEPTSRKHGSEIIGRNETRYPHLGEHFRFTPRLGDSSSSRKVRPTVGNKVKVLDSDHMRQFFPSAIGKIVMITTDARDSQPFQIEGSDRWLFRDDVQLWEQDVNESTDGAALDASRFLKDNKSSAVSDSSSWNTALSALTGGSWKDVLNIWSN